MTTPHQTSITILQVQHDDAFVDDVPPHPYHTRYFDIITTAVVLPPPQSVVAGPTLTHPTTNQEETNHESRRPITFPHTLDSLTAYEDAIIMAIINLRDLHIGSSISDIRNYIQDNYINDLFPNLKAKLDNEQRSSYYPIKNSLFLLAMRSLWNKNIIEGSSCSGGGLKNKNGSCNSSSTGGNMSSFHLSFQFLQARLGMVKKQHDIKERKEAERVREIKFHRLEKNVIVPAHGKVPLSKPRLFDLNAGVISEREIKMNHNRNTTRTEDDMDLDESKQTKFSYLAKPCTHENTTMFITKRKKLGKAVKIPSNRIIINRK